MELPVLVEQTVWPTFREAVESLGDVWRGPSGRTYMLRFDGRRLEVTTEVEELAPPPPDAEIDRDLLELAAEVYDHVGGDWSSEALRNIAGLWGWDVG